MAFITSVRSIIFFAVMLYMGIITAQISIFPREVLPLDIKILNEPAPGYIFMAPVQSLDERTMPENLLVLDSIGNLIFFAHPTSSLNSFFSDFRLLSNGLMAVNANYNVDKRGYFLLDSSFQIIDSFFCHNDLQLDGHDFLYAPGQGYLYMCYGNRETDLSGFTTTDGSPGADTALIVGQNIQLVEREHNLIWEWIGLDYFEPSDSYEAYFRNPASMDLMHGNSLEIDLDGNYILSSRNLHEITKIESETGQIIWRLGGKNNQFRIVNDTVQFGGQHDARRLTSGNLSIFDNGLNNNLGIARYVEYELDEISFTATKVREIRNEFGVSSAFVGNAQELSNGGVLINWGGVRPYSQTVSISEYNAADQITMEIDLHGNALSYRVLKFQLPWKLKQPVITCVSTTGMLDAGPGYSKYVWSTGETTRQIMPLDTGNYQVFVNYGIGYLLSEVFTVKQPGDPCSSSVSVAGLHKPRIWRVYPNPGSGRFFIDIPDGYNRDKLQVQILQLDGTLVESLEISRHGPTGTFHTQSARGLYIMTIMDIQSSVPIGFAKLVLR